MRPKGLRVQAEAESEWLRKLCTDNELKPPPESLFPLELEPEPEELDGGGAAAGELARRKDAEMGRR